MSIVPASSGRDQNFHAWSTQLPDLRNTLNHANSWIFDPLDGQNSLDTFTFLDIETNATAWTGDGSMIIDHLDKADNDLQSVDPHQWLLSHKSTNASAINRESDSEPLPLITGGHRLC